MNFTSSFSYSRTTPHNSPLPSVAFRPWIGISDHTSKKCFKITYFPTICFCDKIKNDKYILKLTFLNSSFIRNSE